MRQIRFHSRQLSAKPKWRVKTLLMKLESDRKNSTDYFSDKFVAKVSEIFSGLPKPKDWQSFQKHDLPLIFTASEVQQFALDHKLNKAQTKAVSELHKAVSFSSNLPVFNINITQIR